MMMEELSSYIRFRVGEHDFDTVMESEHRDFRVKSVKVHPGFADARDGNELYMYNDLAVVEIDVPCMEDLKIVRLPDKATDFRNRSATVIGWGIRDPDEPYQPPILQTVTAGIYPHEMCKSLHPAIKYTHMCATDNLNGENITCYENFGGLLHVKEGENWVQVGIESSSRYDCLIPGQPTIYTNVSAH
ncbi:unnamed protein product, partial [Darwinula stevensoni]